MISVLCIYLPEQRESFIGESDVRIMRSDTIYGHVTKSRVQIEHFRIRNFNSTTMFKSILSSRRDPSDDFTVITPLSGDISCKENLPALAAGAQMPLAKGRTATKGFIQTSEKKKKADHKKLRDIPSHDSTTVSPQAFDKLLVRL